MIHDHQIITHKNPDRAPWALDDDLDAAVLDISGKAEVNHTHEQGDVTDLEAALATKQSLGEYHITLAASEGGTAI